jgi:transcriptional regulator with XRE-family HTH domain
VFRLRWSKKKNLSVLLPVCNVICTQLWPLARWERTFGGYITSSTLNNKRAGDHTQVHNRIEHLMSHTYHYAFKGRSRLAADTGLARSTITRILDGRTAPTFIVLWKITRALESALGRSLDPRELVSVDGAYPTLVACHLAGKHRCTPDTAYTQDNDLRPEFRSNQSSQPSTNSVEASESSVQTTEKVER